MEKKFTENMNEKGKVETVEASNNDNNHHLLEALDCNHSHDFFYSELRVIAEDSAKED